MDPERQRARPAPRVTGSGVRRAQCGGGLMRRARILCALFCAPIVAGRAAAQVKSAAAAALTIDQAVAEAMDHNLSLVVERYNVTVAEARTLTAGLRPNPVV